MWNTICCIYNKYLITPKKSIEKIDRSSLKKNIQYIYMMRLRISVKKNKYIYFFF